MPRFWVGFYASGETVPGIVPFRYWTTGWAPDDEGEYTIVTLCALVDAPTADLAEETIRRYWPDARMRLVDQKATGWEPASDRFQP